MRLGTWVTEAEGMMKGVAYCPHHWVLHLLCWV